ncbi:PREDICTED: uncharacterized protein C2orf74 homolog [Chrysochloris asiatica]|uniref:Uncharacterized protein C2orf74 homolog n=1 Tax=Chrysochloris asiatica TaxID=185453 RepID=A0A9B0TEN1_CHRAS|nr:PREDICTED: uncharacterized protein C2orf74 homolog [Chrysochloris asiatica]
MQTMDEDTPERHGILVQRQRKVVMDIPLDNKEDLDKGKEEAKTIKEQEPENAGESGPQGESLTKIGIPMDIENQKRPLKGVTFSRDVVVVDLWKKYPTPQSCTREHENIKRKNEAPKAKSDFTGALGITLKGEIPEAEETPFLGRGGIHLEEMLSMNPISMAPPKGAISQKSPPIPLNKHDAFSLPKTS